jgi:hypothetical protein
MNFKQLPIALAACLLVTTAWAQSTAKPLNLKLPANLPASSSSASAAANPSDSSGNHATDSNATTGNPAVAAANSKPAAASTAPGVYYGDTSGRVESDASADDGAPQCDDSKYNQPQMHGSVSTGVVSASHGGSGSWSGGEVNLSQAFGSCDHPTGGISISIGGESGHFHH